MFTTDANLKAENEELKKELLKTKNKVRKLNEKCESYRQTSRFCTGQSSAFRFPACFRIYEIGNKAV